MRQMSRTNLRIPLMYDRAPDEQVAAAFWEMVGCKPQYPFDPEEVLLWSQPDDFHLICEGMPQLDVDMVHMRAQQLSIEYQFAGSNRRLRGCLLADRGSGCILYDASDPANEQRFTKGHELAHFLVDYYFPRTRALQLLGESIRSVLDGLRPPTLAERTHAAMMNIHLGVLSRLMERPDEGLPGATVLRVEDRADRIALELIAPFSAVIKRLDQFVSQPGGSTQLAWLTAILQNEYALPGAIAAGYARELIRRWGGSALLDWIISNSR
jgi:hypothetical protein